MIVQMMLRKTIVKSKKYGNLDITYFLACVLQAQMKEKSFSSFAHTRVLKTPETHHNCALR